MITGKSCSGKNAIADELEKLGYKRIVTYTTRGMRDKEIDGVTYNFIKTEEFFKRYLNGFFLEIEFFDVADGIWFYGSSIDDYINADDKTFCILTPNGIEKLKDNNIKHTCFYIDVSDEGIKRRQIRRNDNIEEARRRFIADKLDFQNIDKLADYEVFNENVKPELVAETIDILYRKNSEGRSE